MTRLSMTATQQPKTGASAPLNLTTLLAAGTLGSNTGVSFVNTGREVLYVQSGVAATTASVQIGTTIEGQPVTAFSLSLHASDIDIIGPYPADENQPGGLIFVDFGTAADVTGVALVQNAGVL